MQVQILPVFNQYASQSEPKQRYKNESTLIVPNGAEGVVNEQL